MAKRLSLGQASVVSGKNPVPPHVARRAKRTLKNDYCSIGCGHALVKFSDGSSVTGKSETMWDMIVEKFIKSPSVRSVRPVV